MTRKLSTLILIAILSSLMLINTTYAQVSANLQITEYTPENETWIGIVSIDNELTQGIVINRADQSATNEDDLQCTNVTLNNDRSFDCNAIHFVYTVIDHTVIITDFNANDNTGKIDGTLVQFNSAIDNGSAIIVKYADAYSVNGIGYVIQNNTVITYTAFNNENTHKIYLPIIIN